MCPTKTQNIHQTSVQWSAEQWPSSSVPTKPSISIVYFWSSMNTASRPTMKRLNRFTCWLSVPSSNASIKSAIVSSVEVRRLSPQAIHPPLTDKALPAMAGKFTVLHADFETGREWREGVRKGKARRPTAEPPGYHRLRRRLACGQPQLQAPADKYPAASRRWWIPAG